MEGPSKRKSLLTAGVSVGMAATLLAACGSSSSSNSSAASQSKAPIQLGVAVGLTGYLAADDVPFSEGVKLAAAALNAHGGVNGHKIVVTVSNMDSSAATGVTVVTQMIDQTHIDALIGGSVSAATAAYAPLLARAQVPMVAASVLPSDNQWEFSTLQPTSETNADDLGFVKSKLHLQKVAVIYSETPYGEGAAKQIEAEAAGLGLNVVSSQGVLTSATDITPQLQTAVSSGAQAIVDVLTGPIHLVEAKDAANLGMHIPIIMGQDTRSIFKQATSAYPNVYWTALGAQVYPANVNPAVKAANAAFGPVYQKSYGSAPGEANAARGWDSVQILAQAIRSSGAITGKKLDLALQNVSYAGNETEYRYSASDHTGQLSVANPLGIGHYVGGKKEIVYTASK